MLHDKSVMVSYVILKTKEVGIYSLPSWLAEGVGLSLPSGETVYLHDSAGNRTLFKDEILCSGMVILVLLWSLLSCIPSLLREGTGSRCANAGIFVW